ncbi:hypothetical protein SASPL_110856 [Salvia splendens]|uniref:Multidrug resistance protein, MATE family n=1 Tax=Salvia splendens TaxID=180675 RepID=A0A8X9A4L2_SALSN|nr:hypothetical protein SASPL_110856 [Salvia splendens]
MNSPPPRPPPSISPAIGGSPLDNSHREAMDGPPPPASVVNMLLHFVQVISLMFVGHLGELQLSSASMATSFAAVTGFSVLLGMVSALETLCGQAYGAKHYQMLGVYTTKCWRVQPLDDTPGLFAYGILQCLIRFLQTQNIVYPMMVTSAVTGAFHVFLCWLLVFKLKEAFRDMVAFLKLAVPSALMICLEYWSFELVVLLSGAVNELGAGNAAYARLAVIAASEKEVIVYVARILPLLAVSNFLDGFQCVLAGAARGCGVVNLGAY